MYRSPLVCANGLKKDRAVKKLQMSSHCILDDPRSCSDTIFMARSREFLEHHSYIEDIQIVSLDLTFISWNEVKKVYTS